VLCCSGREKKSSTVTKSGNYSWALVREKKAEVDGHHGLIDWWSVTGLQDALRTKWNWKAKRWMGAGTSYN